MDDFRSGFNVIFKIEGLNFVISGCYILRVRGFHRKEEGFGNKGSELVTFYKVNVLELVSEVEENESSEGTQFSCKMLSKVISAIDWSG